MQTVVFADITRSTALFETLGDSRATEAVMRLTRLMAEVFKAHGGRIVKTLGDGLLAVFSDPAAAVAAMVALQREHQSRAQRLPAKFVLQLRAAAALGPAVEQEGDWFGEAVNLAARLCDLAAGGEIWVNDALAGMISGDPELRVRSLGHIPLRGFSTPKEVSRVDWNTGEVTAMQTLPATLAPEDVAFELARAMSRIDLDWMNQHLSCAASACPVFIGRARDVDFPINDLRVSRQHARIDWVENQFVLTDLSSYGTWVRLGNEGNEIALRRNECVLVGSGELALGAPFSDFTAVVVTFAVHDGTMILKRQS